MKPATNQRLWISIGLIVFGTVLCGARAYKGLFRTNRVMAEITASRDSKSWPVQLPPNVVRMIPKMPPLTHTAGPFTLDSAQAPYSFVWEIEDGGRQLYRHVFMLHNTAGQVFWSHVGTNKTHLNSSVPGTTQFQLPQHPFSQGSMTGGPAKLVPGSYQVSASIVDMKGVPAGKVHTLRVIGRKVAGRAYLPKLISREPAFIAGFVLLIVGLVLMLIEQHRAHGPSPRPQDRTSRKRA